METVGLTFKFSWERKKYLESNLMRNLCPIWFSFPQAYNFGHNLETWNPVTPKLRHYTYSSWFAIVWLLVLVLKNLFGRDNSYREFWLSWYLVIWKCLYKYIFGVFNWAIFQIVINNENCFFNNVSCFYWHQVVNVLSTFVFCGKTPRIKKHITKYTLKVCENNVF